MSVVESHAVPWQIDIRAHYGLNPALARTISVLFAEGKLNDFIRNTFYTSRFPEVGSLSWNFLRATDCAVQVNSDFLANVPGSGPVIFLANHPSGVFDGHILLSLLLDLRPDTKIIVNRHFQALGALRDVFLFADVDAPQQTASNMRPVLKHLSDDGALIVFPAAEVSRPTLNGIRDRRWRAPIVSLAARKGIPVVPVHIDNRASAVFYLTAMLAPALGPLALLGDVHRRRGARPLVRFGRPLNLARDSDPARTSEALRREVYRLPASLPRRRTRFEPARPNVRRFSAMFHHADAVDDLGGGHYGARFHGNVPGDVLSAIGAFRKEAYGARGYSMASRIDLDPYDPAFTQVVLWNQEAGHIDGTMRIKVHPRGLEEACVREEFDIPRDHPLSRQSTLEIGRFAIRPRTPRCDALWRAASAGLDGNLPDLVVGTVSLPTTLPRDIERFLVTWGLQSRCPSTPAITARNPAEPLSGGDIAKLAPLPAFDPDGARQLRHLARGWEVDLPVLVTAYPKIIDFKNHYQAAAVDPKWGNAVDLLSWARMADINAAGRRIGFAQKSRCTA